MEKYFIWLLKKKGTFRQVAGLLPGSVLGFVLFLLNLQKWRNKKKSILKAWS